MYPILPKKQSLKPESRSIFIESPILFRAKFPSGRQFGRVANLILRGNPIGSTIWMGLVIGMKEYREDQTPQLREPQDMTEEERLAMEMMEMFKPKRSKYGKMLPLSTTNVRIFGKDRASTSNSKSNPT